jgi:hypothetical protein
MFTEAGGNGTSEIVEVPNVDSGKIQPWRQWLAAEANTPCASKPWIGWKPDRENEHAKPWLAWVQSAGIAGAGPTGNAGG